MKKQLLLLIFFASNGLLYAQDVLLQLQYQGNSKDSFYVYMVPAFTRAGVFNMGTSQVTLVFENSFGIASPVSSTIAVTPVNGGGWTAQEFVQEPGAGQKKYVSFVNGLGAAVAGGVQATQPVLLFRFRVIAGNCAGVLRNYANGIDPPDPAGTMQDFTTYINEAIAGDHLSSNSSITMQSCNDLAVLPVHFLGFSAVRSGQDAKLDWTVSGETLMTSHYEIQRSTNGNTFHTLLTLPAQQSPGIISYTHTDQQIQLQQVPVLYYRIRQVDRDERAVVSETRSVRTDQSQGIHVYPNPVVNGFYTTVTMPAAAGKTVQLRLVNSLGQAVWVKSVSAVQLNNYYTAISGLRLSAGQYQLQLIIGDQLMGTRKLMIVKE